MSGAPVTYPVSLADLVDFADGAAELDGMRQFYVDRPAEQQRISQLVARIHAAVERAAGSSSDAIYAPGDRAGVAP